MTPRARTARIKKSSNILEQLPRSKLVRNEDPRSQRCAEKLLAEDPNAVIRLYHDTLTRFKSKTSVPSPEHLDVIQKGVQLEANHLFDARSEHLRGSLTTIKKPISDRVDLLIFENMI